MKIINSIILLCLISSVSLWADISAQEIAEKSFSLPQSEDQSSLALLALIDSRGIKRIRQIQMYSAETQEGRNSFMEFTEPADVAGTRFLTIGYDEGDDEQRIYLPALGRPRRINSSNRGGSFMGSDFSYYDMENHTFEDFTYTLEGEEVIEGKSYWIILRYPQDEDAPYSKQRTWICQDTYFTYKHECYEEAGTSDRLIKTIYLLETEEINGIPITTQMLVENHQNDHRTMFQLYDIRVNTDLPDSLFTVQNLTN